MKEEEETMIDGVPQRAITTYSTSQPKYDSIYFLALQGFKADDVVALSTKGIKVLDDGTTVVKHGTKVAKLTMDEAKVFGEYVRDNMPKIKEYGRLFFGKTGQLNPANLSRDFGSKLKKFHGKSLYEIGWASPNTIQRRNVPVETVDDIKSIFAELQK